ncbi:methenyltetrahydromethanopterin cyclohydrolase [Cupriavidus necator]
MTKATATPTSDEAPPPTIPTLQMSVNSLSQPLLAQLLERLTEWNLTSYTGPQGIRIVDAGVAVPGSVAAGIAITGICMGGLGEARLRPGNDADGWPMLVEVHSAQPVLACLASQYAGWSLAAAKEEAGGKKFFALGSGPARALACKEALFDELGYRDEAQAGCLVLEVDRAPPEVVVQKILRDCGLRPEQLTVILTPTSSQAGTTQVVGRVLEVALHKAHVLGFPLASIVAGSGCAPLPAPAPDGIEAMGRTNDAILYGGRVHLTVDADDAAARELAQSLPSANSEDYGRPFAAVFKAYDYDFYQIDPALFAPAEVWVSSLASGHTWHGGKLDMALLREQWLREA